MAVQMKDIAERAGVSISTVSHIVNNTRPVAADTRGRVLAAMQELNYYKNAFGRRLARGRADAVGLIVSDVENPFFPELIRHFEAAAVDRGLDTFLCTTNYNAERARSAVRRLIENKVEGVAVMTSQLDPALVDELVANDIPVVRLDSGPARRARSNVRPDYSSGAREAVRHLAELGHKHAGFISGPEDRVSAVAFRQAVLAAFADAGLPPPLVIAGDNTMEGGAKGVRSLLEAAPRPTAVLCGNDLAALGAIRALSEEGVKVPDEISVVGADDISYARYSQPALTTIRMPRDQLARLAFDAIDRMLRSKRRAGAEYVLETHLVARQSTGAAPAPVAQKQQRSYREAR